MIYTKRIERALQHSAILHDGQYRKGGRRLPYISHPVSVMIILSEYTDDEDLYIAALMHDTVEDTDYTFDQLEDEFGKRVKEIVAGVTESKYKGQKKLSWLERKQEYVKNLKTAPKDSCVVAAADKIHNLGTMVAGYNNEGVEYWDDFGGTKKERLSFYGEVNDIITLRLSSPIAKSLECAFHEFEELLS